MKRFFVPTVVLLLLSIFVTACSTTPVTGRRQFNMQDDAKMAQLSIQAFEEMKGGMRMINTGEEYDMLQRVGERISQQVIWDMPLAEWEFVLFDEPEVNAFAMPGGKVGVFRGLFQIVRDEDELASVVAHEIAHVTARHTHERMSQQWGMQTLGNGIGLIAAVTGAGNIVGNGVQVNAAPSIIGAVQNTLGQTAAAWDQGKEAEADQIGIIYMAQSGYDPSAAIRVMERMVELDAVRGGGQYNSSHPSSLDRLNALHSYLDEALEEYNKSKDLYF